MTKLIIVVQGIWKAHIQFLRGGRTHYSKYFLCRKPESQPHIQSKIQGVSLQIELIFTFIILTTINISFRDFTRSTGNGQNTRPKNIKLDAPLFGM